MGDVAVAGEIGILASHGYGTPRPSGPSSFSNFSTQHIWQTEVSDFGVYDGSITSALNCNFPVALLPFWHVNSWQYWQLSGTGGCAGQRTMRR